MSESTSYLDSKEWKQLVARAQIERRGTEDRRTSFRPNSKDRRRSLKDRRKEWAESIGHGFEYEFPTE